MPVEITRGFESIPEDHPLYGLTAPLIAAHNHVEERMHGTAFVIAPELALTARHVVVDYLDKIQNENIERKMAHGGDHTSKMTFFMFLLVLLGGLQLMPEPEVRLPLEELQYYLAQEVQV